MTLPTTTRLGPYEILAPLGAGGMGEVYRARDTRLLREVAIKVLARHLSNSPEIRSRFEREARTVSSLNHPHICTLHDVGREGDTDFLVMELVEGETLAHRLTMGPLPPPEVLRLGAQISDALDRAHRAGVIHRDLKPGNVMLTRLGVKLMDFGLARATGLDAPSSSVASMAGLTQSPTMAQPLTAEGTIVGTFQYMAPEQLEGKEANVCSDLWALGCVLYEMATGKRAFEGSTQASLISAIMRDQPRPISQLSPLSPPALERLVNQCLAKDPEERWQSAGDIRRELEWIRSGTSQSAAAPVPAPRPVRLPAWVGLAAGGAIAAGALIVAFGPWAARTPNPAAMRFTIMSPPGMTLMYPAEAELSPDGRAIVYVAGDSVGTRRLFLRSLDNPQARALAGTEGASLPFWSPDGRRLGFFAAAKLKKMALDGSPPSVLCDAPDPRGGSWSRDETIVFAPNNQGGLFKISASGGTPEPLTKPDPARKERGHRYPQFLPDGRHFLFVAIGIDDLATTFAGSIDGGKPVEIRRGGAMARFAPPDHVVFREGGVGRGENRRVLAQRFDPGARRLRGEPRLLLDRASATNFGYSNITTDARGTLVAQQWDPPRSRVTWKDRSGRSLGVVADDLDAVTGSLSPDGRQLAYPGVTARDLMLHDLDSGISRRLSFENQPVANIVWSPDGRFIAFTRLFGFRGWQARVKAIDTGQDSALFSGHELFNFPQAWSRDGRWLVVLRVDSTSTADLWKVPMTGGGSAQIYQRTRGEEQQASLSPDGKWIAYVVTEDGRPSLFVQSFPDPGIPYQVTVDEPAGVAWNDRGDVLGVGTRTGELLSIQVSTASGFRQGATTRLFRLTKDETLFDVERGGQRFLIGTFKDLSATTYLDVVLNWRELLDRR
ncbi:MAG TPA: protein kinase [Candidatus Eisenbacteria bacterium]|nr:protein kinase [Candidatus Eisenbacteria bacterium]